MATPTTDEAGIRQAIKALRTAGWTLSHVHDGEEDVKVDTVQEAVDAITAVDDAHLFVRLDEDDAVRTSWVRFVLGNEPFEVIADHGVTLEDVLTPLTDSWDD